MADAKEAKLQEYLDNKQHWWWAEQARSPRIDYLRKAVWSKGAKAGAYLPGTKVGSDGPILFAEIFDDMDARSDPYMTTFSRALENTNTKLPVYIVDNSRIVGCCAAAPHEVFWVPNLSFGLNEDIFNDRDELVDMDKRDEVEKCLKILKPYTQQFMAEKVMSKRHKIMCRTSQTYTGGPHLEGLFYCTSQFTYYSKGFNAIIEEIDAGLKEASNVLYKMGAVPNFPDEEHYLQRVPVWEAMKRTLQSEILYAKRLARLARIISENFETDSERKQELLDISERCEWVPANRPRNFPEALQFEHLQTMARKREKPDGAWPAHPDWWFGDWFDADMKSGYITREDAIDYVGEYLIRSYEYGSCRNRQWRELMTGDPGPYVWTFGGMRPDGSMDYRDLINVFMEASRYVRCVSPTFALRYNKEMPEDVLKNCFDCIRHGLGYPNIRNDQVLIKANMFWSNTPEEEARTWVAQACIVPAPETKHGCMPMRYSSCTTLGSKCMELALWNGYNPVFKMQIGPKTGDPCEMTFDQLMDAFIEQFKVIHWDAVKIRNIVHHIEEIHGRPHLSATYEMCVEDGINAFTRKEYGNAWVTTFIWMDGCDALVACKKLVYDEKKYTMAQLLEFLKANWEGYEKERMDFVKAPKWGNDDPYADDIIVKIHERVRDEVCMPCKCWGTHAQGVPCVPQNVAAYTVCSNLLGALPNGRRLGDTCYDGGCSPGAGNDKKGPTAVLNSVGKLEHENMFRANLLNQRLSPTQLAGDKGFDIWNSYIQSWCDLGINHVQFNIVDNETLIAAQEKPEDFEEMIVRVAGYSAQFVGLNKKTQDTIIARTIQEL